MVSDAMQEKYRHMWNRLVRTFAMSYPVLENIWNPWLLQCPNDCVYRWQQNGRVINFRTP